MGGLRPHRFARVRGGARLAALRPGPGNAIAVVPEDTGLVAAGSSLHCLLLES